MPFQKDPRIPPRTPEQVEEEMRYRQQFRAEPPPRDAQDPVRPRDLEQVLRLVGALKKAHEAQGRSMAQLAEESKVDESALSRLLGFKALNPNLSTVFRIAAALGFDLTFALEPSTAKTQAEVGAAGG